jgi:hypothetical protein
MKKSVLFIIALVLTVGIAAFFTVQQGRKAVPPTPPPPAANAWRGVEPGVSTTENLMSAIGTPLSSVQNGTTTTYLYPSANQYWRNEVDAQNNSVAFIRERIFPPSDTSLKSLTAKITEKPVQLYGPDFQSGTLLYVYPASGVAFLASSFQDTAYQVWYFIPTTLEGFLALPQAAGYGTAPAGQQEGI